MTLYLALENKVTASFAERVLHAMAEAQRVSAPFMTSQAERELSLLALVNDLWFMPHDKAWVYICATFTNVGYESLAITMFKERIAQEQCV